MCVKFGSIAAFPPTPSTFKNTSLIAPGAKVPQMELDVFVWLQPTVLEDVVLPLDNVAQGILGSPRTLELEYITHSLAPA